MIMDENAEMEPVLPEKTEPKESWRDFIRFALIASAIVVPIRLFIAQPFIVSGASMVPNFQNGNYLIIDELSYRFEEPRRGEVVVFRFPYEPSKFLIKRIVGIPNETVVIEGDTITIKNTAHPAGFVWEQGAITSSGRPAEQTITLGADEYFVLGDNRDASADSRLWGALSRGNITGRPIVRLFPLSKIALFPGVWADQQDETKI